MNEMVQKLMEEEIRLTEKAQLFESTYRSQKIDIDALLKSGQYITADEYRESHK